MLGLPRGGVPVAFEVAAALGVPLDVIVVRKLGVPFQPELAMGAIGEDGVRIVNEEVVRRARRHARPSSPAVEARERLELARRAARFRGSHDRVSLAGRTALIVDDGIATGSTVRAACEVARAHGADPGDRGRAGRAARRGRAPAPGRRRGRRAREPGVVLRDRPVLRRLHADLRRRGRTTARTSRTSHAVGVRRRADGPRTGRSRRGGRDRRRPGRLAGHLTIPSGADGVVLFAHGSGSSRHSARNRFVADVLNRAGLGTLLFDLLTADEERDRSQRVRHRAARAATRRRDALAARAAARPVTPRSATSARAPAPPRPCGRQRDRGADVAAVVSRGGRPDLAGPRLAAVRAPTLLIVGGNDAGRARAEPQGPRPDALRDGAARSSRARRTSSRSRARSQPRPSSPATGSSTTSAWVRQPSG